MNRWGLAAAAMLALGCGEDTSAIRSSDLGELWLAPQGESVGGTSLEVSFGTVKIGERRRMTIDAFNAGADPIKVSAVGFEESTDSAFYLNAPSLPIELAAGERFSVQVTYAPFEEGPSVTRLELKSSGRTFGATGTLLGAGER